MNKGLIFCALERFHSFFGYLSLLSVDLFPRTTEISIKTELDKLDRDIEEKSKTSASKEGWFDIRNVIKKVI